MSAELAIKTANLRRIYRLRENKKKHQPKELVALSDVSLQVPQGELFSLLGPNGAGKSTLIKILVTLLAPSSGWARVAGYDFVKETTETRRHINMVSGGEVSGYGLLTVRENLWMFSQFYGIPLLEAYRRVGQLLMGVFWTIFDDREHYKTIKCIYTSPIEFVTYLIGRSIARLGLSAFEVAVLLLFSVFFFHLPISLSSINWGLLFITLFIGIFHISFLGLILAGISLQIVRHSDFLGELVAGTMYFFTGAVFPLDTLEPVFRAIGLALPVSYWLELIRRAILGSALPYYPTLGKFTNPLLMLILVLSTIFFGVVSLVMFKDAERRAKKKGMIDMVTNY